MELRVECNMSNYEESKYKTLFWISIVVLIILILFSISLTRIEDTGSKKLVDEEPIELSTELPDEPLSLPPSYDEGTSPSVLP